MEMNDAIAFMNQTLPEAPGKSPYSRRDKLALGLTRRYK